MSEIAVLVNGHVQWRFVPHGEISADELTTPRTLRYPPIPLGAALLCDGQPLGTVRCVRRASFSRWTVVFDPVDGRRQTVDGEEEGDRAESISPEIFTGTPISALAEHLDPRVLGTVEQLALTVEELSAKTDAALRDIDGIGPKRLREIRAACDAVLNG